VDITSIVLLSTEYTCLSKYQTAQFMASDKRLISQAGWHGLNAYATMFFVRNTMHLSHKGLYPVGSVLDAVQKSLSLLLNY